MRRQVFLCIICLSLGHQTTAAQIFSGTFMLCLELSRKCSTGWVALAIDREVTKSSARNHSTASRAVRRMPSKRDFSAFVKSACLPTEPLGGLEWLLADFELPVSLDSDESKYENTKKGAFTLFASKLRNFTKTECRNFSYFDQFISEISTTSFLKLRPKLGR